MKLLFVTQVMDKNDSVLGAYHSWAAALAARFEQVTVICLREGEHSLPGNVTVYSLGKECGRVSRWRYSWRFLNLVWQHRPEYDAVLVHMNQEYILLAGWLWKLWNKKIYLWRNHYSGSFLTDIAAAFCTKIFCTSRFSYTAKYKKTIFMPVGIDTNIFTPNVGIVRVNNSVLFLARMSPSKRAELLIEALGVLRARGVAFVADFVGSPLPKDAAYYESLKARVEQAGLAQNVRFLPGIPNIETPALYSAHAISVNCSPSGMFDKTLFEAAACGALVAASSEDFVHLAGSEFSFKEKDSESLAERLFALLALSTKAKAALMEKLRTVAELNSLERLTRAIEHEFQ